MRRIRCWGSRMLCTSSLISHLACLSAGILEPSLQAVQLQFASSRRLALRGGGGGAPHLLSTTFSSQLETMVGGTLTRASALRVGWVSIGRLSHLDHVLTHRIRVIGGCVIWVWWVSR